MARYRMILSQLVDSNELEALSPEELRDMLVKLDEQLVFGDSDVVEPRV